MVNGPRVEAGGAAVVCSRSELAGSRSYQHGAPTPPRHFRVQFTEQPTSSQALPSADQAETMVRVSSVALTSVLDEIEGGAHVSLPEVRVDPSRCIDGALQILYGGH